MISRRTLIRAAFLTTLVLCSSVATAIDSRRLLFLSGNKTAVAAACSGGSYYSINGSNTVITFRSSGILNCTRSFNAQALIVAGGGAGGGNGGGGGGGGGVCSTAQANCGLGASLAVPAGGLGITVGVGGVGSLGANGGNGGNSLIGSAIAVGGGGGGHNNTNGLSGGSGGGAGGNSNTGSAGGAATAGQGNAGGNTGNFTASPYAAGGGGGAGGVGGNATSSLAAGNGGPGIANSITGSTVYYGAGGGGGFYGQTGGGVPGVGGITGGGYGVGADNANYSQGSPGAPNTGAGGGGSTSGGFGIGANGGSGVVAISCPTALCGGVPPAPAYLGLVASRFQPPDDFNSGNKSVMSRTYHVANVNIKNPQVIFQNANFANSANFTLKFSIEYPVGTCWAATFSGSSTVSTTAASVISDAVSGVNIPAGAGFYIDSLYNSSSGTGTITTGVSALGEGQILSTTLNGAPDYTACNGTVTPGAYPYTPIAVIAQTTQPSFLFIGDSRVYGTNDVGYTSTNYANGEFAHAIVANNNYAFADMGVPGSKAYDFINTAAYNYPFKILGNYVTYVFNDYGINDLNASTTAAELTNLNQRIRGIFPTNYYIQSTVGPNTNSTDNWATIGNQTLANASANTQRVVYNDALRVNNGWVTNYAENANVTESAQDSGFIAVNGTANYCTLDGLHWNPFCYSLFATQGIGALTFHYP